MAINYFLVKVEIDPKRGIAFISGLMSKCIKLIGYLELKPKTFYLFNNINNIILSIDSIYVNSPHIAIELNIRFVSTD